MIDRDHAFDVRVAVEIMGWGDSDGLLPPVYTKPNGKEANYFEIPEFSSNASADVTVLREVRENWEDKDMEDFHFAVTRIWQRRWQENHLENIFNWAFMYEPGDYSRAAITVLDENRAHTKNT